MREDSTCSSCETKLAEHEADEEYCLPCEDKRLNMRTLWERARVAQGDLDLLVKELNEKNGWGR